jgi:hypothetical protein
MLLFSISVYKAEVISGAACTFLTALGAGVFTSFTDSVGFADAALRTSSCKIRPTGPLPTIPSRDIPDSFAVFLAKGLAKILSPEALVVAAGVLCSVTY